MLSILCQIFYQERTHRRCFRRTNCRIPRRRRKVPTRTNGTRSASLGCGCAAEARGFFRTRGNKKLLENKVGALTLLVFGGRLGGWRYGSGARRCESRVHVERGLPAYDGLPGDYNPTRQQGDRRVR
eukprot:6124880-Pyramimonas_sp.AAC.1